MRKNTKALSTAVMAGIIITIVVVCVIAAAIIGGASTPPPAEAGNPVTVYIEGVEQEGNYTTARTIDWGAVSPGNTYTKNFTVINNQDQALLLKLYTTEPEGATQSWARNNTLISALSALQSTLVLTLDDFASSGQYTWKLLAVNGTAAPTPTPSPTASPKPTPTPAPETLECTVESQSGLFNLTITNNQGQKITRDSTDLPYTFIFKQGDTLTFEANALENSVFDAFTITNADNAGLLPFYSDNPVTLKNIQGNFTITAEFK